MSWCARAIRKSSPRRNRGSKRCWCASRRGLRPRKRDRAGLRHRRAKVDGKRPLRRNRNRDSSVPLYRAASRFAAGQLHHELHSMTRRRMIALVVARAVVILAAVLLTPNFAGVALAASLQGFGIVYLHGKAAWPGALNGGILSSLEDEGALVAEPEMPWSFHRRYAATYNQAMSEIDAAVAGLKAKGATRIVIIGHSLGANAAIGYAARHPDLAGVAVLAP